MILRFFILMLIGLVALGVLQITGISSSHAGIDAKTKLKLKLKKPDIVDSKFIEGGRWRFAMGNDGRIFYDNKDVDGDGHNEGGFFPRGLGTNVIYAAGPWIGAIKNGIPVVSETMFATEFQPGHILNSGVSFYDLTADSVNHPGNRVYVIDRSKSGSDWTDWPQDAHRDANGDPALIADVQTWAVFNDLDTTLSQEGTGISPQPGLGLEITMESFSLDRPEIGDAVFLKYSIHNKTNQSYGSAYFGLWADADVDHSGNDLLGSDSSRGIGYTYNTDNSDEPLAVGFDFVQGPLVDKNTIPAQYQYKFQSNTKVLQYNANTNSYEPRQLSSDSIYLGATSANTWFGGTDPTNNSQRYNLLQGLSRTGGTMIYGSNGWFYPGNPVTGSGLIHTSATDQRFLISTGPFRMEAGSVQEIWAAVIGGHSNDRLGAVSRLMLNDDIIQSVVNSGFGTSLWNMPSPVVHATTGDGFVTLHWDSLAESMKDPIALSGIIDTAHGYSDSLRVYDFQGYRVYRSLTGTPGSFSLLAQFDKIDDITALRQWSQHPSGGYISSYIELGENTGLAHSYTDQDVNNGQSYYYAVTAYDAQREIGNRDFPPSFPFGTNALAPLMTPLSEESPIASSLIRATPQPEKADSKKELDRILVVPNPLYVRTSAGEQIKFTGLPATCTIRIFTVAGDLVKTLHHHATSRNDRIDRDLSDDSRGLPDYTSLETWNLNNEKNYAVASGVYIALITSKFGQKTAKFAVIR